MRLTKKNRIDLHVMRVYPHTYTHTGRKLSRAKKNKKKTWNLAKVNISTDEGGYYNHTTDSDPLCTHMFNTALTSHSISLAYVWASSAG